MSCVLLVMGKGLFPYKKAMSCMLKSIELWCKSWRFVDGIPPFCFYNNVLLRINA